jgi:flagellar hook-basal body complex protein FliE
MLDTSIDRLQDMLTDASQQSAALAAGEADDLTSVVVAVERAMLGLQLATQVRNKAVEAYQDLLRMQI